MADAQSTSEVNESGDAHDLTRLLGFVHVQAQAGRQLLRGWQDQNLVSCLSVALILLLLLPCSPTPSLIHGVSALSPLLSRRVVL